VRLLCAAVVCLVGLVAAAGVRADDLPLGIKGQDDRIAVDGRRYPWSTIGRLTRGDGSLCSGVLIGPDLVLTAAHCLWNDTRQGWATTDELFFAAGLTDDLPTALSGVVRTQWPREYHGPGDLSLDNSAHDWAILTLRDPIGTRAGWLGVSDLSPETYDRYRQAAPVLIRAGYSVDRRATVHAHLGCHLVGWARPGLLAHDCDATEGDSGSPVFAYLDGSFRLLALHVSTFREGSPEVWGGAIPAGPLVREALANRAVPNSVLAGGQQGDAPLASGLLAILQRGHPTGGVAPSGQGGQGNAAAFR